MFSFWASVMMLFLCRHTVHTLIIICVWYKANCWSHMQQTPCSYIPFLSKHTIYLMFPWFWGFLSQFHMLMYLLFTWLYLIINDSLCQTQHLVFFACQQTCQDNDCKPITAACLLQKEHTQKLKHSHWSSGLNKSFFFGGGGWGVGWGWNQECMYKSYTYSLACSGLSSRTILANSVLFFGLSANKKLIIKSFKKILKHYTHGVFKQLPQTN